MRLFTTALHGTGIVEKLPLQLRRKRVPLHDNRRAEAPKNVPFFLGQGEGIRRILRMNRLLRIVRNPTSVIGKLGEPRSSLWTSRISSGLSVPLINSEYSSARARYCLGVNIWSPCCNEYLSGPSSRWGLQLWSTGCVKGATAFESATFSGFAHAPRNRIGLLFRQTQASEGIIQ
jgi:hypothetical protein